MSRLEKIRSALFVFVCALMLGSPMLGSPNCLMADDWTQWRGNNRDGVWRETGLNKDFSSESLKPLWRQKIGTGYSSPTVAGGKVFVMDYDEAQSKESVRCFDSKTGEPVWAHEYSTEYRISYAAGPRSAVTIDGGKAYAMGAMGQASCIEIESGKVIWAEDLNRNYKISESKRMPIWGMACSPLIVGDRFILQIGAKEAGVVALDKNTGNEIWRSLEDRGQYTSPVLAKQNGKDVVVCWTGDSVAGLNPESGEQYWGFDLKPTRMPIGVATPVINGNKIFLTSFYDGSTMLEMTDEMSVKLVWRGVGPNEKKTEAIHSIISTPIWIGEHIYGVDSYGELRCLSAVTGERIWEDTSLVPIKRWATIHFVQNGDDVWMLNEVGELMVGKLGPMGATVKSRAKIIEPNQMRQRNRKDGVLWSHPAFANKCVFVRNDSEIVCYNLSKK
jgi:outer membrane protein assembly factor BamB